MGSSSTEKDGTEAETGASSAVDAVIVGAGLGGLYALYKLREMGYEVCVFEAAPDVGGTWYWNRYPGARCDVESVDYSYSFSEELEQEWDWTERYASQGEILSYIQYVADRFDLRKHITFNTRVESARFNEADDRWEIQNDKNEQVKARFCVMATGNLSVPQNPDLEGVDMFKGEILHPGRWPAGKTAKDFAGKNVAVIGTGSSGIQIIPAVAREAERLTVFQRTPNYSMPAHNHPLDKKVLEEIKRSYRERRKISWRTRRGFPVPPEATDRPSSDFTPREQQERLEAMWRRGGAIFTSTFGDLTTDLESNAIAAEFVRNKIRAIVKNPKVAELLCPKDYPLGGKRPCVDTDYYETFNRENVELIDINQTPLMRFTEHGLETTDRHFKADAVICATGYDAITGALSAIEIRGVGGRLHRDAWKEGPSAYLGLITSGFPNLFLITGPGSPSVLCNMTISIEQHVNYMADLIKHAESLEVQRIDADPEAEQRWIEHVNEIASGTLLVEANSWYLGANTPGKPRRFMPYAGGMNRFIEECSEIARQGYAGFKFESAKRDLRLRSGAAA